MIDLYAKPKSKLKGISFDEKTLNDFCRLYPKLLSRASNRMIELSVKNRHFLENLLFSEIDFNGNFTVINYPDIPDSTK